MFLRTYEIPRLGLGYFDYTLFLGVLYHLRHPLLALNTVCGLTKETVIVDSFVLEGDDRAHIDSPLPWMEFTKPMSWATILIIGLGQHWTASFLFAGRPDSRAWNNETSATVTRDLRAIVSGSPWGCPTTPAPVLVAAVHGSNFGLTLRRRGLRSLTCWFTTEQEDLDRERLRPEVAGCGVSARPSGVILRATCILAADYRRV